MIPLALIALAYLLGSIPSGLLIARAYGIDIRSVGSGNIGATNVGRVLGRKGWIMTFAADLAKGLLGTLAAGWVRGLLAPGPITPPEAALWVGAMAAAILGHMHSPWLRFTGGKGVAVGLGAALGVFPHLTFAALAGAIVYVLVVRTWRYASLASMVAACSVPAWAALTPVVRGRPWAESAPFAIAAALVAGLVVLKHRANIARLRAGTEPRVGQHLSAPPAART